MKKPAEVDPIVVEIIKNKLISTANEMLMRLRRTAYTTALTEIKDLSIGIFNTKAESIANTLGIPCFGGTLEYCIVNSIKRIGEENLAPGDVIMTTNPYWTGGHSPDSALMAPIFYQDELIGFTALKAHNIDLGTKDPSYLTDSTDMFQEGLILPAVKVYSRGELVNDIWDTILANSRYPQPLDVDLKAEAFSLKHGTQRVHSIIQEYGKETYLAATEAILDNEEKLVRQIVSKWPDGTWSGEDAFDDDGLGGDPIPIKIKITIKGSDVTVDLTGTGPQAPGPVNSSYGSTYSASIFGFKALTRPFSPPNSGGNRPLSLVVPEGTLLNPTPPAPTFLYFKSASRLMELIPYVLREIAPDKVPACSGGDLGFSIQHGFNPDTGWPWVEGFSEGLGIGGSEGMDGENALIHYNNGDSGNVPVEITETRSSIRINRLELRQDSGGAGKWRGGLGTVRDLQATYPYTACITWHRYRARPWGIDGGKSSRDGSYSLIQTGRKKEKVYSRSNQDLNIGDICSNRTNGGAGYGDPLERDPDMVQEDVLDGYISIKGAYGDYGVVLDEKTNAVDLDATKRLREEMRRMGGNNG
jgi:N-methylhydantoinase B